MIRAADLLEYEDGLRSASDRIALVRFVVDATPPILDASRILFFQGSPGRWRLAAASDVSVIEPEAPAVRALERRASDGDLSLRVLNDRKERPLAAVLVESANETAEHRALLERLARAWREALLARGARAKRSPAPIAVRVGAAAAFALVGFVPVPLVVLAPFEIVPDDPVIVAAPFDGVIERMVVASDSEVAEGAVVARFEARELRGQLSVAEQRLLLSRTKLEAAKKRTFAARGDDEAVVAASEQSVAEAERNRHRERLKGAELRVPVAGLLLHEGEDHWDGRPVRAGERIARVAQPDRTKARAELALSDAVTIEVAAKARLFPDGSASGLAAEVARVSYLPEPTADGRLAYRVDLLADRSPRIGVRGVARIEGPTVTLAYRLFRRPWIAARQWLGV